MHAPRRSRWSACSLHCRRSRARRWVQAWKPRSETDASSARVRHGELLLSAANLVVLAAVVRVRHPAPRFVAWFAAVAIGLSCAALEGVRAQMVPALVVTGALGIAVWARFLAPLMTVPRWLASSLVAAALLALSASIAAVAFVPVFELPHPTGPHAIGTVTLHWTDDSRDEMLVDHDDREPRQIVAQVWYPAQLATAEASELSPYIADASAVASGLARLHGLPAWSFRHLGLVTSHARAGALVADDVDPFPVLLFIEGLTGYRQMNSFQIEELVSHGYVVVGLDLPGVAAAVVLPDGRVLHGLSKAEMEPLTQQSAQPRSPPPKHHGRPFSVGVIQYLAEDVSFAIDSLTLLQRSASASNWAARLDLELIGVFGVSFGGMAAAQASLKDPRIKACLVMDVLMTADVVSAGLSQPALWITRDANTMRAESATAGGWTESDILQTQRTMRAAFERSSSTSTFVLVPGMFHIDFTDLDLLSPLLPMLGISGPVGAQRAHEIVNALSLAFFDDSLKRSRGSSVAVAASAYPEVIVESRAARPVHRTP